MSFTGELWGRTSPLEDPMPKSPEGGTTDLVIRQARIIHELRTELEALKKFTACTRSHPHEAMAQDCELRTEIARLTNELARLRAAPAVPQEEIDKAKLAVRDLADEAQANGSSEKWVSEQERQILAVIAATPAPAPASSDGIVAMVDAAMVEMKNISPPLRRSECERLIRAAIESAAAPAQEVGLTPAEIDRAVLEATGFDGFGTQPMNTHDTRNIGLEVIAALRAKGGK